MKKQYKIPRGKSRITIRLDDDVLDWFRKQVDEAGGGSYQNLINRALRAHIDRSEEPLEAILRRVVREELRRAILKLSTTPLDPRTLMCEPGIVDGRRVSPETAQPGEAKEHVLSLRAGQRQGKSR